MSDIIHKLKNHPTLTTSNEMRMICQPLFNLGISDFIFLRIYHDGSMVDLSTNADWSEFYFKKFYGLKYPGDLVKKHIHLAQNSEINLWELVPENKMLVDAKEYFGIQNGISIEKKYPLYKEVFYFASKIDGSIMNYFYLNNLCALEKFNLYFKERAANLIKIHELDKLLLPDLYLLDQKDPVEEECAQIDYFIKNLNKSLKEKLLPGCSTLSPREIECAAWVSRGKSASEIATIIGLSARTVECHINNLKNKVNCYKLPELIYKLAKLDLI